MKVPRNLKHVPDENFLTLMKAIKECPKTWQELEKKSIKAQIEYDKLNRPRTFPKNKKAPKIKKPVHA